MTKQKIFVVHFCKNKNCNNAWLDLDLTNARTNPPRWKYCSECCKKYGFTNPESPPKKKLSEQQLKTLQENQFQERKKSSLSKDFTKGGILYQKSA